MVSCKAQDRAELDNRYDAYTTLSETEGVDVGDSVVGRGHDGPVIFGFD